eukprot:scaffold75850_cov27-Tisochrysis_lutea.AAC.3
MPVFCYLWQAERAAEVHEVKDVLLEARAAETNRRFEELRANPAVDADCVSDLVYISACCLA